VTGLHLAVAALPNGLRQAQLWSQRRRRINGFRRPDARLGFGYAMNRMLPGLDGTLEDPRWRPLMDTVYAAL
jgi:hypothetical protein